MRGAHGGCSEGCTWGVVRVHMGVWWCTWGVVMGVVRGAHGVW